MKHRTLLAAVLAAGSLLGAASVAHAVPAVVAPPGAQPPGTTAYPGPTVYSPPGQVVIVQPPPAPIHEAVPAPREGFTWSPGHHEWRNGQYVWVPGQWLSARPGFAWRAGHWEQRADGSWQFVAGHWVRSDDVAMNERRGPFGDRDGDGVINRDDNFPSDPTRY